MVIEGRMPCVLAAPACRHMGAGAGAGSRRARG